MADNSFPPLKSLTWIRSSMSLYEVYWEIVFLYLRASLVAQRLKCLPAMWETWVRSLGWEDPLEKETATHSSILTWRIPWTEELGGLQSTGCKESDTTERLDAHFHFQGACHSMRWIPLGKVVLRPSLGLSTPLAECGLLKPALTARLRTFEWS